MITASSRVFAIVFFSLAISACGWHLRGTGGSTPPLSQLYLTAIDSKGALITELRQLLKSQHATLVNDEQLANYSLSILEETKEKHTSGVGGDAASSAYEITLKVDYEVRLKGSTSATKETAVSVRSFNYNTSAINSATQEEALLDQEIRRDIANQMLRRLSAIIATSSKESHSTQESPHGKVTP